MNDTGTWHGWKSLFTRSIPRRRGTYEQRTKRTLKLETLETRRLMDATPLRFNIPSDVEALGVYVAISGQLTQGYHSLQANDYVYFDSAINDYALVVPSVQYTFQVTNGQEVELPDAGVTGGEIDIGVGSPPVVTYTAQGLSTPAPSTSPTQIFGLTEFSYGSGGLDLDMSEVDQVGFPFTITTDPDAPSPAQDGVGLNLTRSQFFDRYTPYIASQGNTAAPFEQLVSAQFPYRLVAPQDVLSTQELPTLNPVAYKMNGLLQNHTDYFYWVTAINAYGETMPSNLQRGHTHNAAIPSSTHLVPMRKIALNWTTVDGATGYNLYRSLSADVSTAQLLTNVAGTSFTDDGSITPGSQTPPTSNYSFNPLGSYFNAALDSFFTHYESNPFSIDKDGFTYSGNAINNYLYEGHNYTVLALSASGSPFPTSSPLLIFKPYFQENTDIPGAPPAPSWMVDAADSPGEMIFGASGSFADGVEQYPSDSIRAGVQKDIENAIDAAFNRGLATEFSIAPDDWSSDPSLYYASNSTANWYAAFLHTNITTAPSTGVSINALAYGFPYDDQGGDSTNFQGNFDLVNINLMPWGSSPVPPGVPTSLIFLTQPVNGHVGSEESVTFQVLGANGQPFLGGALVVGNVEGAESGTFTAITNPTTGIGTIMFQNHDPGTSLLQLTLTNGESFDSHTFDVYGGSGPSQYPICPTRARGSIRSMALESVLRKLGLDGV